MRRDTFIIRSLVVIGLMLVLADLALAEEKGKVLYDQWCSSCHGEKGDGKGPAADFVWPKPRDFTKGTYKFKTTGSGEPVVDADLTRTIRDGNPGTSMPAWSRFSDDEVRSLVAYLKAFSPDTFSIQGTPFKIGNPPGGREKLTAMGKELYQSSKCWECHGKAGKGDGEKGWQEKFKDDWGNKIYPADQTSSWEYRAGSDVKDVFKTISVGFDGTPMTSYGDTVTEEKRWAIAYYVASQQQIRHLGPALRVKKVEILPATTDDPVWNSVEYLDLAMAGQVIFEPREFTTLITNARLRGVYTNSELALMIEWTDKQQNKGEEGLPPDAAHIQFPAKRTEGTRPYFFRGDKKLNVNLWQWQASSSGGNEYIAAGPDEIKPQEKQGVRIVGNYIDGRYRILFTRTLQAVDDKHTLFEVGRFMPFSVSLYDGRNNEQDKKGAISAWYYLMLEPPTPAAVYFLPPIAFLGVLGAGFLLRRGLKKKE